MENIEIVLVKDGYCLTEKFTGKYRRDLEKENWHYYEEKDGAIRHYKKSAMLRVRSIAM